MKPRLRTLTAAALLVALLPLWPAAPAQAQSRRAIKLVEEAREAFSQGKHEQAAELLLEAYELYPNANFIWNVARAYEQAQQFNKAEGYFRRFAALEISEEDQAAVKDKLLRYDALQAMPDTLRAAQDEAKISTLRLAWEKEQQKPAPAPAPVVQSSSPSLTWWGGWTLTGLGSACLLTAGGLHLASLDTVEQYHQVAAQGTDLPQYNALRDTLQSRVTASRYLLGAGLLMTLAGGGLLAWEIWGQDDAEAPPPAQTDPGQPRVNALDAQSAAPRLQLRLAPGAALLEGRF